MKRPLFPLIALCALALLAGCESFLAPTAFPTIPPPPVAITPVPTRILPTVPPPPTAPPLPADWIAADSVMSGLCFESVWDAAGQVFVIRTPEELTTLFDLADNSRLCRRPVQRGEFDFSGGRVLVGTWSRGRGCDARHELSRIERDDAARLYAINLRLIVEGTCDYELVRPFWIGVSGVSDYDIRLRVE